MVENKPVEILPYQPHIGDGVIDVVDDNGDVVPVDYGNDGVDYGLAKDRLDWIIATEKARERQAKSRTKKRLAEAAVTGYVCGDCSTPLPPGSSCAHVWHTKSGKKFSSDHPAFHKRPRNSGR